MDFLSSPMATFAGTTANSLLRGISWWPPPSILADTALDVSLASPRKGPPKGHRHSLTVHGATCGHAKPSNGCLFQQRIHHNFPILVYCCTKSNLLGNFEDPVADTRCDQCKHATPIATQALRELVHSLQGSAKAMLQQCAAINLDQIKSCELYMDSLHRTHAHQPCMNLPTGLDPYELCGISNRLKLYPPTLVRVCTISNIGSIQNLGTKSKSCCSSKS